MLEVIRNLAFFIAFFIWLCFGLQSALGPSHKSVTRGPEDYRTDRFYQTLELVGLYSMIGGLLVGIVCAIANVICKHI